MSPDITWAILTPGEPAQLASRARAIAMTDADEEDGQEPPFEVIPGRGRYHALVWMGPTDAGAELRIAEELSLEADEPVYSIDFSSDRWTVISWRKGAPAVEKEEEPEILALSLGCPLPGSEEFPDLPRRKPLHKVALVEGVQAQEAYHVLEEESEEPLAPGLYHLQDTPRGLLITDGMGDMGDADGLLSERFPDATVYTVIASPNLDWFFVTVKQEGESIEQFAQPPDEYPPLPLVSEIKGESSPERILEALGIPVEWFQIE